MKCTLGGDNFFVVVTSASSYVDRPPVGSGAR